MWQDDQKFVPDGEIRFNIRVQSPSRTVITTYPWGDDVKQKKGLELSEKFSLNSKVFLTEMDFLKFMSEWVTNMLNKISLEEEKKEHGLD